MKEYFVISLKWTKKRDPYITFWGPDNAGYRWAVNESGRYSEAQIAGAPSYYNNDTDTIAVPCEEVEKLVEHGDPKFMDRRLDMTVVRNSKARMALLKACCYKPVAIAA